LSLKLKVEVHMSITPTALRRDLHRLLDQVIATGEPLEIDRDGVIVRLVPPERRDNWLDRLPRREPVIVGDPNDIIEVDWSSTWDPDLS